MHCFDSLFLFGLSRAGVSVAHALMAQGIPCAGVWTPNLIKEDRPSPIQLGLTPKPIDTWCGLGNSLLILAPPDGQLPSLVASLCDSAPGDMGPHGSCALHLSGSLSRSMLRPLEKFGLATASVHPLRGFSSYLTEGNALEDVFCGIEQGSNPMSDLVETFEAAGGKMLTIDPQEKMAYHGAAAMASNLVIALLASSESVLSRACPDLVDPKRVIASLAKKALEAYAHVGAENALTGPLERGDTATVQGHLSALRDLPEVAEVYRALSTALVPIVMNLDGPGAAKLADLRQILARHT